MVRLASRLDRHANIVLPLIALLIGLAGVVQPDHTNWSGGYGSDGRLYGSVAEDFPGSVFGDRGVAPPGVEEYEERIDGVDSYYVRRILPSGVVWLTIAVLGLPASPGTVVTAFGLWSSLLLALVALCFCLSADRLGVSAHGKCLGFVALMLNFAVLKTNAYFPVLTDTWGFAAGAVALWAWLAGRTGVLVLSTVLAAFAWPTQLIAGLVLLAFPREEQRALAGGRRVMPALGIALALVLVLLALRLGGFDYGDPVLSLFPLSVLASAAWVFFGLRWLLPDHPLREARRRLRALVGLRGALVAGVVAGVTVVYGAIARGEGTNEIAVLVEGVWSSIRYPGLFAVMVPGLYGPLIVVAALIWPKVCQTIREEGGIAVVIIAAMFVVGALLTEVRKLVSLYPILVPFAVLAIERLGTRRVSLPVFALVALVASRFWLPIGTLPPHTTETVWEFPTQAFFMTTGVFTNAEMYLAHIAVVTATVAVFAPGLREVGGRSALPP